MSEPTHITGTHVHPSGSCSASKCAGCPSASTCSSAKSSGTATSAAPSSSCKPSACSTCPSAATCGKKPSNSNSGPDPTLQHIKNRLDPIEYKFVIVSGKGGVGKSTTAVHFAHYLADVLKIKTGILDVDITGPSLPSLVGKVGHDVMPSALGAVPVEVSENLKVMSIGFMLEDTNSAIIWRGPRKSGFIKSVITDVDWSNTDALVIDTPPGTSDEHLTIVNYLRECGANGAVIVTTPQEVAMADVRKEIDFCRRAGLPIIGIVENMSGFVCPNCEETHQIFPKSGKGPEGMAEEYNIPYLGAIPLNPTISMSCENGSTFVNTEGVAQRAFINVCENIMSEIKKEQ
ncbi:hypothetical protein PCE1_001520 [Barthelona sp. PCE]